jgi:hypothetical protein
MVANIAPQKDPGLLILVEKQLLVSILWMVEVLHHVYDGASFG